MPAFHSVRAEVIETSGGKTCESLTLDSYLTLYDRNGVALGWDDDAGRGLCSLIDGTGAIAANAFASRLPGDTYYLAVEAAPAAQVSTAPAGKFTYRLVVTIR